MPNSGADLRILFFLLAKEGPLKCIATVNTNAHGVPCHVPSHVFNQKGSESATGRYITLESVLQGDQKGNSWMAFFPSAVSSYRTHLLGDLPEH